MFYDFGCESMKAFSIVGVGGFFFDKLNISSAVRLPNVAVLVEAVLRKCKLCDNTMLIDNCK